MWLWGQSDYQGKSGKVEGENLANSGTIILDELWCLELGKHNDLREVGQTI